MESLLEIDYQLFEWINSGLQNDFLDLIMPFWRSKYTWIPLYICLLGFLFYRYKWKGLYLALAIVAAIGVSDTISSKIIKPSVQRLRPCKTPVIKDTTHMLINCGSGYSFTSSHATNHFTLAVFLMLTLGRRFKNLNLPLAFWAASVAFGQVYVGAHFPLDVIAGALVGTGIGGIIAFIYWRLGERFRITYMHTA